MACVWYSGRKSNLSLLVLELGGNVERESGTSCGRPVFVKRQDCEGESSSVWLLPVDFFFWLHVSYSDTLYKLPEFSIPLRKTCKAIAPKILDLKRDLNFSE